MSQTMQFVLLVMVLIGMIGIGRAAKHIRRATFLFFLAIGLAVFVIYAHPEWGVEIKEFIDTVGSKGDYE